MQFTELDFEFSRRSYDQFIIVCSDLEFPTTPLFIQFYLFSVLVCHIWCVTWVFFLFCLFSSIKNRKRELSVVKKKFVRSLEGKANLYVKHES